MTEAQLQWRVEALEKMAERRDALTNKIAGQQDDQLRKLDRVLAKVDALDVMARASHEASEKVARILAEKAAHEKWTAEQEEQRGRRNKKYAGWVYGFLAVLGAMISLFGGFVGAAVDQARVLFGAFK
jgi:hypothetical protein